jgi:hypothetical protein
MKQSQMCAGMLVFGLSIVGLAWSLDRSLRPEMTKRKDIQEPAIVFSANSIYVGVPPPKARIVKLHRRPKWRKTN